MLLFSLSTQKSTIAFIVGFSVGLVLSTMFSEYLFVHKRLVKSGFKQTMASFYSRVAGTDNRKLIGSIRLNEDLEKTQELAIPVDFHDGHSHHDDETNAAELRNKVRILCWVMTSPQNLDRKAIHVKKTWARRCNVLLFMSSTTNDSFPTIGLNVSEGRQHLTAKTMQAFRYVYNNHYDEADWFLKADDDTYVIMENMRYFLSNEDTNKPIYFGHHFKTSVKQGYFSGGAGYIISKEALRKFQKYGNDSKLCQRDGGAEDVMFGRCMEALGVKVGSSFDALGRSRFHCFNPEMHIQGNYAHWYYGHDSANGTLKVSC